MLRGPDASLRKLRSTAEHWRRMLLHGSTAWRKTAEKRKTPEGGHGSNATGRAGIAVHQAIPIRATAQLYMWAAAGRAGRASWREGARVTRHSTTPPAAVRLLVRLTCRQCQAGAFGAQSQARKVIPHARRGSRTARQATPADTATPAQEVRAELQPNPAHMLQQRWHGRPEAGKGVTG